MYSREQIERVRSSVDIADVIRGYVPSLKASGRSVRGLCPFHSERTPSFFVHSEKGMFKCFGCGESGDVIAFLAKIEQATFTEALERLAAQAGITLKREATVRKKEDESLREKLFRVLEEAARIYQSHLWDKKEGARARHYLDGRGLQDQTILSFRLGLAPSAGGGIFETLIKKGFSIELCQKAGLVSRSESGRYFDPMFGRVIFPITDNFGHVVGFGGRALPGKGRSVLPWGEKTQEDEGPKYLNSPESPVFSKGRLLYGLDQAKPAVLSERRVLILEGYMDVIGVSQSGVKNAVATLGTALTRDHAKLLKRYADEAIAFFDPDEAGRRAAMRSAEPLLQESLFPRVIQLKESLDPDEWILRNGPDKMRELMKNAPDFVDWVLGAALSEGPLTLQRKSALVKDLGDRIRQTPDPVLKSEWMDRIARALGIRPEAVGQRLGFKGSPGQGVRSSGRLVRIPSAEDEYVQLVINSPATWGDLGLTSDDFTEASHRRVFQMIQRQLDETGKISLPEILDALEEPAREWFSRLTLEEKEFSDPLVMRDQFIRDIRLKHDRRRLTELRGRINAGEAGSTDWAEFKELLKKLKGSGQTAPK